MLDKLYSTAEVIQKHIIKNPRDIEALTDLMAVCVDLTREDDIAREYVGFLLSHIPIVYLDETLTLDDLDRLRSVQGKALLFSSHYLVDSYFQYLEWNREASKRFYLPRREHIRPLMEGFQAILDDEIDVLTVSCPPGIGKSTIGTFFMTMIMGLYPDSFNAICSYADSLTKMFYTNILSIITDSEEYCWGEIFPNVGVAETSAKETTIKLVDTAPYPTLMAKPIGGSLTGRVRCNKLLYIDDLVSGSEEALNKDRLDKLWHGYGLDLKSRIIGSYKEVMVATRWSVHDPIGRLQELNQDNPRARFIVMPAVDEYGKSLFNYKYNVGLTDEFLEEMRRTLDDAGWSSLYMNEPYERDGLVYSEDELRRFYELPVDENGELIEPDARLAIVDTKDTGKDYAFMPIVYVYGNDHYVVDCVLSNGLPERVEGLMVQKLMEHKVQACRFESNQAGGRIADKISSEIKKLGGITHITKKFTTSNKETKIIVNSPWVKEHCLFLDRGMYDTNSDYASMIRFLCSYTLTGKNQKDDVPDGMAMYATYAQTFITKSVEVFMSPLRRR